MTDNHQRLAAKQGDSAQKNGVVGAFCRTYNIYAAMDKFLPGVYVSVDNMPDRYTYAAGRTTGGAVVYDYGAFLFSHHATDPCGGRLANDFDLVRLHLYGDKDDEAQTGTPTNRRPFFTAMCEFAVADQDVSALLNKERCDAATQGFAGVKPDNAAEPENWMSKLQTNAQTGAYAKTTNNVLLILENDPLLAGKIAYDEFANKGVACGGLPWDKNTDRRTWTDNDDAGSRWCLEKVYSITGKDKITDALSLCGQSHAFDDVKTYLHGLKWDGVLRLDTLFINYLGAADTPYIRAVTRKAFTAAVARVMIRAASSIT